MGVLSLLLASASGMSAGSAASSCSSPPTCKNRQCAMSVQLPHCCSMPNAVHQDVHLGEGVTLIASSSSSSSGASSSS